MYSSNIGSFVGEFWNKETNALELDEADEIIAGSLLTRDGQIVNERIQALFAQ